MSFTDELVVFGLLLVLVLLLRFARTRAWLLRPASALVARFGRPEHTPEWERDHAELWLMARRQRLLADLRRIESLLLHDETMSATRQLGNRLAREQLLASLARIPDLLPAQDRSFRYEPAVCPAYEAVASPALTTRGSSVEVLDVSGW